MSTTGHDRVSAACRRDDGFSLIELMVVVLIIGILIAIALPTFLGARERAQDRATQSTLRTGLAAALTYYAEYANWDNFDDVAGEAAEPSLDWVDGGAPSGVQISIHVHSGSTLLLVRRSGSGRFFCVAQLPGSPATDRGQGAGFGDVDTAAKCDTGW